MEMQKMMKWISRKVHLYNVTVGLYMLDWWERYLFNMFAILLLWYIYHNCSKSATEFCLSYFRKRPNLKLNEARNLPS